MNLLIVGHGRMGRLVETYAGAHGLTVVGVLDDEAGWTTFAEGQYDQAEVAIDFSFPRSVRPNLERLAARGVSAVIGTTGWQEDEPSLRDLVAGAGIGVLAAANFSLGMHVFRAIVEQAAWQFALLEDVGAWIHETHHAAKRDAPSGTAVVLAAAMKQAGYGRSIDMASTRAGWVPGTHVVGFDGAADTVTLTHTVRDRAVFAHGALEAARWLRGRQGWFGIDDMFNEFVRNADRT
ncbi:MAG TPA: dihydrodipicolinate reductase C-terminal domain-containing protein [Vicinamibacterales bacterium]|nr:dihydrodipicolinate reductase C-terminal domain-containing protein [Vicinamibacterales bacterium]